MARQLLDLTLNYKRFYTAFTYASRGLCRLAIEGNRIEQTPRGKTATAPGYEAYNILTGALDDEPAEPGGNGELIQCINVVLAW